MKTVLLKVDYTENTGKWFFESYIKNKTITFDPEKQTIHEVVAEACEDEGMTLSYKGKPQGNVYRDNKTTGECKVVGYMYRGKSKIHDRNMPKAVMTFWDVWVSIQTVESFEFENIDN